MSKDPATVERVQAEMLAAIARPISKARLWQRKASLADAAQACAFCGLELSTASSGTKPLTAWLIPPSHGGPVLPENVVLCCRPCRTTRRQLDVLSFERLSVLTPSAHDQLLRRRLENFSSSMNHLTPHSPHGDRQRIVDHLANRFTHARFRCFVAFTFEACWIGWPRHDLTRADAQHVAALLRYQAQGSPHPSPKLNLFAIPKSSFLDTVWDLIERNALVEEVPSGQQGERPGEPGDWRQCWHRTFSHVSDIHKRRSRTSPEVAPWPTRQRSMSASAKSHRKAATIRRLAGDRREYLAAKHQLADWLNNSDSRSWTSDDALNTLAQTRRMLELKLRSLGDESAVIVPTARP